MAAAPMSEVGAPIIGPVTQLGFVVRDIEAALDHWVGVMGVRPFLFCTEGSGLDPRPTTYREQEVRVQTRLAFGFVGEVQVELIEQVNGAPSPYREFIDGGREGLQHLGYWIDDHEAACRRVEAAGYVAEYLIHGPNRPRPVVYYRTPSLLGPMLELIPPELKRNRQAVLDMARNWTGGDPLVRHRTYGEFLAASGVS